jgi:chromosome segregation protein
MKIKKITIHGFKSFVDKTTLEFSKGTSGIIGPNGCGKSNIVDAIRWVIGEQNPRHLRGKHMEDVIFNGSDTRGPLGMAEVVLTFANDNGSAPARYADFTEIEITRRLYRSGESEYYINKVQSRLRDIVDLFTDTGIGTRAYSIVEQGQVGWLINAKPEERRAIFEEAAGINKFKHKKTAALRRLEATNDNLTRVNDIIGEVKRQLNSLNRQAKKAERYKAFREELREAELELFSIELASLTLTRTGTSARLAALIDEEMALSNSLATREGLATELRASHLGAEVEYRSVRESVHEFEMGIQEHERSSALIQMRLEEIKRNEERLAEETRDLTSRSESEAATLDHLARSLEELSVRIEEETGRLGEHTEGFEAISGELRGTEEEVRSVKAESLNVSTRLQDIRHSIGTLLKDEEMMRVREAKARSEKQEVGHALEASAGPLGELGEKIDTARLANESIATGLSETKAALEGLTTERAALDLELGTVKQEHARSASRLAALEEMETKHENLHGGARSIMQQNGRAGVHGVLADCIEAKPGYERAVESVLGERLQYVIVESHREGVEAIDYLTSNAAGRGSFVPLRDLRAVPVPAEAGGIGASGYTPDRARPLIGELQAKDGFEQIVNYLMGDVLLVDTLEDALDIWNQNGIYRTLVTRSGELLDPQGIITGGVSGSSGEGILQQRAEIKATRVDVAALEDRIGELTARFEQTTTRVAETTRLLEERRERLHAAELDTINLESELARLTAETARLAERDTALTTDIEEAEEKLSGTSGEKAALTREREGLEGELTQLEERSAGILRRVAGLTEKKDAISASVTDARVSLAQTRERHDSLAKEIEGLRRMITEALERIKARGTQIEDGKREALEKEGELSGIKSLIEEKLGSIEGLKGEEAARGETLAAIDEKIAAVEAELKEIKSRASDLAELKGELTIEVREADLKVENIQEKAIEKYGVRAEPWRAPEAAGDADGGPTADGDAPDMEPLRTRRAALQEKLAAIGDVNMSALEEYAEHEERYNFLLAQQTDLTSSVDSLMKAITRINRTTRERFRRSFEEINEKFKESFPRFFNGGRAELRLTEGEDILDAGIEIVAQPPGKRLQNITLLSGGEKALTATSLIFSIFLTKPSPFCLLDEVDAPLDDANIDRFNTFVTEMSKLSQFLVITHNKKTMEMAGRWPTPSTE